MAESNKADFIMPVMTRKVKAAQYDAFLKRLDELLK